jgi:hypothetical protein
LFSLIYSWWLFKESKHRKERDRVWARLITNKGCQM